MGFFRRNEKDMSPSGSLEESQYPQEYSGQTHDAGYPTGQGYDDDLPVPCPAHTTERKLMAKIDARLLPALCILYLLAFLDRINIGNASIYGLTDELELGYNNRYNTALVIFFVPYVVFEVRSAA